MYFVNQVIMMNKLIVSGILPLMAGPAAFAAAGQGAAPGQGAEKNTADRDGRRPNILFILSDDHTSQTWGIYGGVLAGYAMNDNIERLASEGVVLDNCFCTNSISAPSRASILTGRYSHTNGVYTLDDTLSTGLPTIATVLQASGYNTALVGKWHLKSQPQGFDWYSIFYDQGVYRDPTFINRYWTQHKERPAHIGVRTDRYKLIFFYGDRLGMTGSTDYVSEPSWEFYDLLKDPHEDHNAYSDPEYQAVIRKMKKEMMRLKAETGDTDPDSERMHGILAAQGLE